MKLENKYQVHVIGRLRSTFEGCFILKNNPNYLQGIPDLTVLHGPYWALLEVKKSASERHQPNQDYYVEELNAMSFAAFIYPENEDEVFSALQSAFRPNRYARVSQR